VHKSGRKTPIIIITIITIIIIIIIIEFLPEEYLQSKTT